MTATTHHPAAGDGHGHGDHHGHTGPHVTRKDYVTGFVLAAILTAIPFWLVMSHVFGSTTATAMAVMAMAAVQVVVHMIYFLHMNSRNEGGWSLLALMFTMLLVGIVLTGSLWVMYHLDVNMMPTMSVQDARQMP